MPDQQHRKRVPAPDATAQAITAGFALEKTAALR
jgi:hypothetical protein